MEELNYIFGPVPSRRMGQSLGVSPIPKKTCNYSCIYCQLGRTNRMTNERKEYFPLEDILEEFDRCSAELAHCDVVTIVGEGEPTLYLRLGDLIQGIQARTDKPVAVITNGALMGDPQVRKELSLADIVLPSMDSFDEESWRKTDRPHKELIYQNVIEGLKTFSEEYEGQLYLEIMLMNGINDSKEQLDRFKELLKDIKYTKVYLNTPVRPPAEADVSVSSPETLSYASDLLNGISIEVLASGGFYSELSDDYEAILGIIGRHPMNQHEINGFLESRNNPDPEGVLKRLAEDPKVKPMEYKGYCTYRLK